MKRYTSLLGKAVVLGGAFLPVLAFAEVKIKTFESLVNKFIDIIQYVIPLIFSIALVAFLWGIFQYFFSGAEKKEEAKDFLLYGIIGLFIMVSVWGLVKILTGTFPLDTAQPNLPSLGTGGSSSGSGGSNFNTSTAGGSGGGYFSGSSMGSIEGQATGVMNGSNTGSPGVNDLDRAAGAFPR
jgi:hypothetical protein